MNINDIIAVYMAGNWWALALAATIYARHMLSDKSKFPWTIPATWLPTVTSAGTLITGICLMQAAHKSWTETLLASGAAAVAGGFFDGLLTAIFGSDSSKVPAWAKFVTGLIDDVLGGTTTTVTATKSESVSVKTEEKPPTPPPAAGNAAVLILAVGFLSRFLGAIALMLGLALCVSNSGCAKAQQALDSNLPSDVIKLEDCVAAQVKSGNTSLPSIAVACGSTELAVLADIGGLLLGSPQFVASTHPEHVTAFKAELTAHAAKKACK